MQWLINKGVKHIFYPSVPYERNEFVEANNHYNCPIVTSYPENIKNNMDAIVNGEVDFIHPFLNLQSEETISYRLIDELGKKFSLSDSEIRSAVHAAWDELAARREDMRKKGEETIRFLNETGNRGIVLAGRPYHIDPEVNHGLPEMITSYNIAVLTEDSVSHLHQVERPLNVMDQWMYHSRLYAAANYVKTTENLDLIQLNSFGCGLDAVTTDEVADILTGSDKIYTTLKIDEVNNLGAARIRVRSLLAAIRVREQKKEARTIRPASIEKVPFTKEMRKTHTILCPQMSPIHFELLEPAFKAAGYKIEVLPNDNRQAVDMGLKYVNNDACYPSLIVVGQIMDAILSGQYDTDHLAVIISQTGGGCRASNYIGFIRRALKKAGYEHIPVISINLSGLEANPGFKITLPLAVRIAYAAVFGDIFMKCVYRIAPLRGGSRHDQRRTPQMGQRRSEVCIRGLSVPPEIQTALPRHHLRFRQHRDPGYQKTARGRGRRNPCEIPAGCQQPPGRPAGGGGSRGSRSGPHRLHAVLLLQPELQSIPPGI